MLRLAVLMVGVGLVLGQCPGFIEDSEACTCSSFTDGAVISCSGNDGPAIIEKLKAFPMVIRDLSISNANIVEIGPRAFRNLQIKNLKLDYNKIARIDPDAFRGLETSLTTISIAHNKLTEVPTDALTAMRVLNVLNLRCNNIGNIFGSVFRNMTNLIELNLGCNQICNIEGPAFDAVRVTLQSLVLDQNCLSSLPTESLAGFPALIGLHLQHNRIENLTEESFPELPGMLLLRLSANMLRSFPSNASLQLPSLRYLYLDSNRITNLEPDNFQSYQQLEILDLSYNEIAEVPANSFKSIETLMQLKLQGNFIRDIGPNAFANTPLLLLLLNDNCLTSVNRPIFLGVPFLRQLSLSNNGIRQIQPFSFTHLPNLHILDLSSNRLDTLEPHAATASAHVTVLLAENPLACTSAGFHLLQGGQPIHLLSEPNLICLRNGTSGLPFLCPATRPRPSVPPCCTPFAASSPDPTTTPPPPAKPLVYSTVLSPQQNPLISQLADRPQFSDTAQFPVTKRTVVTTPRPTVPAVNSQTSINMERFWRLQNAGSIRRFRRPTGNSSPPDVDASLSEAEKQSLLNRIRRPVANAAAQEAQPIQRFIEQAPSSPVQLPTGPAVQGIPRVPIPNSNIPNTAVNSNEPSEVMVDPAGNIIGIPAPGREGQETLTGWSGEGVNTAREFVLSAGADGGEFVISNGEGSRNFPAENLPPAPILPPANPRLPVQSGSFQFGQETPKASSPETTETFHSGNQAIRKETFRSGVPNLALPTNDSPIPTIPKEPVKNESAVEPEPLMPPGIGHNELNPLLTANGQMRALPPAAPSNARNSGEIQKPPQVPPSRQFEGAGQLPPWMQERIRALTELNRKNAQQPTNNGQQPPNFNDRRNNFNSQQPNIADVTNNNQQPTNVPNPNNILPNNRPISFNSQQSNIPSITENRAAINFNSQNNIPSNRAPNFDGNATVATTLPPATEVPKTPPPPRKAFQPPVKQTKPLMAGSKSFFHLNRKANEFNEDADTRTMLRAESQLNIGGKFTQ